MELNLQSMAGKPSVEMINVSDEVFSVKFNEVLIHQVIVTYLAGARAGTRAQKTRAQVKGTGSKPWRQKGTGRARAGSVTSPLWRGGGATFAAKSADFSKKINKKMYRVALRSILSELIRQERLFVVEDFTVETPKTKEMVSKLNTLSINGKVLILIKDEDKNLFLAARNLPHVQVNEVKIVDPVSLVQFEKVLMTVSALKAMEEQLA